jgi:hypothetical protein
MASTSEGSCRLASSEGSNFSSFSMSGALGAVPRVVREPESLERVLFELVRFELAAFELAALEREVLEPPAFDLVDFEVEAFEFELRARGFREPVLREPEDLELPPDLLCAIPRPTIPPPRSARAACLRAETIG